MAPLYGRSSTASRLEPLRGGKIFERKKKYEENIIILILVVKLSPGTSLVLIKKLQMKLAKTYPSSVNTYNKIITIY